MLFTSSGTGAFESAYANLVSPGDRVLVVSAGNFGERWVKMAQAYGAVGGDAALGRGASGPTPTRSPRRVDGRDDLALVVVVHSETSTGSVLDLQAVAERTRDRSALLVVDAISSLGAAPLETDAWGLDVVVTGSQKALMLPPGLAFVGGVRARAGARRRRPPARASTSTGSARSTRSARARRAPSRRRSRWSWGSTRRSTASRPPGSRRCGSARAPWAPACAPPARALGLDLFSPDHPDCGLVTAFAVPEGVDGDALRPGAARPPRHRRRRRPGRAQGPHHPLRRVRLHRAARPRRPASHALEQELAARAATPSSSARASAPSPAPSTPYAPVA